MRLFFFHSPDIRVNRLPVGGVMTMDRTTTGASYGVSAATMIYSFLDSFTHDEWAAIGIMGGLFFGALTWITNVYFQRQRLKIQERDKALAWVNKHVHIPLTEPQKAGIASFCPYNIGPGKCFPSTFYRKLNAGDRKGACAEIRRWVYDGGKDCHNRENQCYGQVIRRDQESALTCWGIDQ
ncbi:glycoside hydrolase family protein [Salmonella enterica]|nr:glycoside hydrolase family protein [Salmonella enterica]EIR4977823.1 glycoside hydrolase family protein [Salmonella enterica]